MSARLAPIRPGTSGSAGSSPIPAADPGPKRQSRRLFDGGRGHSEALANLGGLSPSAAASSDDHGHRQASDFDGSAPARQHTLVSGGTHITSSPVTRLTDGGRVVAGRSRDKAPAQTAATRTQVTHSPKAAAGSSATSESRGADVLPAFPGVPHIDDEADRKDVPVGGPTKRRASSGDFEDESDGEVYFDTASSDDNTGCCRRRQRCCMFFPRPAVAQRLWELFDEPTSSRPALWIGWAVLLLIFVSTLSFVLETVEAIREAARDELGVIETFCIVVFTVELAVRFLTCPNQCVFLQGVFNWVDLLAIVPFYFELLLPQLVRWHCRLTSQHTTRPNASYMRVRGLCWYSIDIRLVRGAWA